MELPKSLEIISPGWEIDGLFEDGSLALDYLQQHPEVNLVVTDIRMPKFDGLELISRIRQYNGTNSYHYHQRILGIFLCQERQLSTRYSDIYCKAHSSLRIRCSDYKRGKLFPTRAMILLVNIISLQSEFDQFLDLSVF